MPTPKMKNEMKNCLNKDGDNYHFGQGTREKVKMLNEDDFDSDPSANSSYL